MMKQVLLALRLRISFKVQPRKAETRPPLAREPGSGLELTPRSQALGKSVLIKHVPSSGS